MSRPLSIALVLVAASILLSPRARAAEPAAQPSKYEWRSLFDGKTLKNWKAADYGGQAEPKVKDGAIILPPGNSLTGVVYTGKDLPKMNYEVSLEAQRVDGSDFFCALTVPVKESSVSLVLGGWGGGLCGISSLDGMDAANNETTRTIDFKNKQWYRVRMRVVPTRLHAWVDDEQIVNVTTKNRKVDVRIEVEPSKPFGLSSFETTGAIRNIRVRELRPLEIEESNKDPDDQP